MSFGPYQRYLDFAGLYSPLIIAHVIVPTLASSRGEEHGVWFLSPFTLPLSQTFLLRHFVFSREALRSGRWWTCVSYMFFHVDHYHLFSNLQGVITAGPAVIEVLGLWGGLLTYFAAGIAGALDLPRIFDLQLEKFLGAQWRWLRDIGDLSSFFGFSSETVDSSFDYIYQQIPMLRDIQLNISEFVDSSIEALDYAAHRMAATVAADVASSRRLAGASAGVFAYIAVDFCVGTLRCWDYLRSSRELNKDSVATFVQSSVHVVCALRFLLTELGRAWGGTLSGVDHAAHLNGALCGFSAFFIAQSFCRWRRPPQKSRFSVKEEFIPQLPNPQAEKEQNENDNAINQHDSKHNAGIPRNAMRRFNSSPNISSSSST